MSSVLIISNSSACSCSSNSCTCMSQGYHVGSEFWSLPQRYGDEMSGITATLTQTEQGRCKPVTHVGQPSSIRQESGTDWHLLNYSFWLCLKHHFFLMNSHRQGQRRTRRANSKYEIIKEEKELLNKIIHSDKLKMKSEQQKRRWHSVFRGLLEITRLQGSSGRHGNLKNTLSH